MKNIFILLFIAVFISACSAPKPSKISFTGNMKPINFNEKISDGNIVIKSSKTQISVQNYRNKEFEYSINENQEYAPEFFYAITHADRIIAHIKPPFIDYVFSRVQSQLRNYGIIIQVELFVEEDNNQVPQVILECVKFRL